MLTRTRFGNGGFSLTELMVILSVSGIVMLAAIPNLHRANETWKLKESVSSVEMSMRRARSTAATKRVAVRVTVDAMNRSCIVEIDTDDDGVFDQRLSTSEIHQSVVVESIDFGGNAAIVFDERGAPDNSGSVILRAKSGYGREVFVSAGSGSVSILDAEEHQG